MNERVRSCAAVAVLILTSAVLFFYRTGDRGLWSSHEGRAAQTAQNMLWSGSWGMPRLYPDTTDYQKPPMYYWMVAAIGWVGGGTVDAWVTRVPAAVTATLCVLVVFAMAAEMWNLRTGLLAGVILATSMRFWWLARVARIDMPLALLVTVSLWLFWLGYRRMRGLPPHWKPRRAWRYFGPAYACLGVSTLLKGPISLALVMWVVFWVLVAEREPVWPWKPRALGRLLHQLGAWWGVPLALAVAAPWFVWAHLSTDGAFTREFFLYHNWQRATGSGSGFAFSGNPVWSYLPNLLTSFLPWIIFLPAGVVYAIRRRGSGVDRGARFALVWFLAMLVLLSAAKFKRADYLLPLMPALAMMVAAFWDRVMDRLETGYAAWWAQLGTWLCAVGVLAGSAGVGLAGGSLTDRIASLGIGTLRLKETDRMTLRALEDALADRPGLVTTLLVILILGAVAAVWLAHLQRWTSCVLVLGAVTVVTVVLHVETVLPVLDRYRNQGPFARRVKALVPAGEELVMAGVQEHDLLFALGPRFRVDNDAERIIRRLRDPEPVWFVGARDTYEMFRERCRGGDGRESAPCYFRAHNHDAALQAHRQPLVLFSNQGGLNLDVRSYAPPASRPSATTRPGPTTRAAAATQPAPTTHPGPTTRDRGSHVDDE